MVENLIFFTIGFFVGYIGATLTTYVRARLTLRSANRVLKKVEAMTELLEEMKALKEDIKTLNKIEDELLQP